MSWTRSLVIDGRTIDDASDPYVIAEIGHNHQGDLDTACRLIDEAQACGADAVKLQKRDNRALFTGDYFARPYDNPNSFGPTYGEHREALEFSADEYAALQEHARRRGVTVFATAFDSASLEFLERLHMPAYKVASGDITNIPLIRAIAATGKPMIISTGAGTLEDVLRAHVAASELNPHVAILQCTAAYPPSWEELDLRVIETYRELFPSSVVGFSSHDNGIAMAVAAYVLGARIVEKHFTLNRAMKGTDHAFSLEPQGLAKMIRDLQRTRMALGDGTKQMHPSEAEPAVKMGKKLVAARELPAGHVLGDDDVEARSPGDGLPPYELDRVVGRCLRRPVAAQTALTFELFEDELPAAPGALARADGA